MSALRLLVCAAACVAAMQSDALARATHRKPPLRTSVNSGGVVVAMDNVTVVKFNIPVATVYMGNPSIADVTMIDSTHAFVLGKRFGMTNLIGLRPDKTVAVNDAVLVSAHIASAVTIYRGAASFNYACSSLHCETRPVPGDPSPYFENTEKPAVENEEASVKAVNPAAKQ